MQCERTIEEKDEKGITSKTRYGEEGYDEKGIVIVVPSWSNEDMRIEESLIGVPRMIRDMANEE